MADDLDAIQARADAAKKLFNAIISTVNLVDADSPNRRVVGWTIPADTFSLGEGVAAVIAVKDLARSQATRIAELEGILFRARSVIDGLMGDSDLPEDDSDEMQVVQEISRALAPKESP